MTKQEITCPKCSYKFGLDQALNREIELHMRKQLSEEFERKESDLRQIRLVNGAITRLR